MCHFVYLCFPLAALHLILLCWRRWRRRTRRKPSTALITGSLLAVARRRANYQLYSPTLVPPSRFTPHSPSSLPSQLPLLLLLGWALPLLSPRRWSFSHSAPRSFFFATLLGVTRLLKQYWHLYQADPTLPSFPPPHRSPQDPPHSGLSCPLLRIVNKE